MKSILDSWSTVIILCLTIGLAPFFPEPHLWGKLKWVAGGAVGMQLMDWFDLLMHGFPYFLLLRLIFIKIIKKKQSMKKLFFASMLGILFLTTTVSCQNAAKTAPQASSQTTTQNTPSVSSVLDLSTADFHKKLGADNSAIILDVRTPQEYANGHLANATAINFFDTDFKEKASKLDKTKPVYVYCAVGGRSAKASKVLQESGFKTVYNLLGGYNGWSAAHLPTVK